MICNGYNNEFYDKHYEGSYQSAYIILSYIKNYLKVNSIIDFGCGAGTWCLAAKNLGVSMIYGIDSNSLSRAQSNDCTINYIQSDIGKKMPLLPKFDLTISVEVGEHISENDSDAYITNLVNASNIILFSAAVPGQEGLHHINEQPLSYWVKKFKKHHFELVDSLRGVFWNNSSVEIWYRNNIVFFAHEESVSWLTNALPKPQPIVDFIHPQLFERKIIKYKGNLRNDS